MDESLPLLLLIRSLLVSILRAAPSFCILLSTPDAIMSVRSALSRLVTAVPTAAVLACAARLPRSATARLSALLLVRATLSTVPTPSPTVSALISTVAYSVQGALLAAAVSSSIRAVLPAWLLTILVWVWAPASARGRGPLWATDVVLPIPNTPLPDVSKGATSGLDAAVVVYEVVLVAAAQVASIFEVPVLVHGVMATSRAGVAAMHGASTRAGGAAAKAGLLCVAIAAYASAGAGLVGLTAAPVPAPVVAGVAFIAGVVTVGSLGVGVGNVVDGGILSAYVVALAAAAVVEEGALRPYPSSAYAFLARAGGEVGWASWWTWEGRGQPFWGGGGRGWLLLGSLLAAAATAAHAPVLVAAVLDDDAEPDTPRSRSASADASASDGGGGSGGADPSRQSGGWADVALSAYGVVVLTFRVLSWQAVLRRSEYVPTAVRTVQMVGVAILYGLFLAIEAREEAAEAAAAAARERAADAVAVAMRKRREEFF